MRQQDRQGRPGCIRIETNALVSRLSPTIPLTLLALFLAAVFCSISLEPNSVLGQVECSDGTFYDLRTSVHGKLVSHTTGGVESRNLLHADWRLCCSPS